SLQPGSTTRRADEHWSLTSHGMSPWRTRPRSRWWETASRLSSREETTPGEVAIEVEAADLDAQPGRDPGPARRAGPLSSGPPGRSDRGAGHGAGHPRGTYRPPAPSGEAAAGDRCRHWQGCALSAPPGGRRRERGDAPPAAGPPPDGGVPLRDAPVPGS